MLSRFPWAESIGSFTRLRFSSDVCVPVEDNDDILSKTGAVTYGGSLLTSSGIISSSLTATSSSLNPVISKEGWVSSTNCFAFPFNFSD